MEQYSGNAEKQENYQQPYSEISYSYPAYPAQASVSVQQPAQGQGKAIASLVLGIVGMVAWLLPIIGLPVSIIGLVLATKARKSIPVPGTATAGYVLCIIALILSAGNSVLGMMLALH